MATDKTERIARLLAQGMQPKNIATLVGVSPSYITNLGNDPDFRDIVAELQTLNATEGSEADEFNHYKDKLAATENSILDSINAQLAYFTPRELSAALVAVGSRRDKIMTPQFATATQVNFDANGKPLQLTQISIPNICAPDLTFGSNNEIVAVGTRSVAPMATNTLRQMLDKHTKTGETYEQEADGSAHFATG